MSMHQLVESNEHKQKKGKYMKKVITVILLNLISTITLAQQAAEDTATTNCIIAIAAKSVAMPTIPAGRNTIPGMPAIPTGRNVDPAPVDNTLENVLKVVSNPSSSIQL